MWVEAMLYLIGAESEHESLVNGAVVMVRNRGDKIAVWCKDSSQRVRMKPHWFLDSEQCDVL